MFRRSTAGLEVFLVHPGGPFWTHKDEGAWGIPKGEVDAPGAGNSPESLLETACREFQEETGFAIAEPLIELGSVRQKNQKQVYAWAMEAEIDPASLQSNTFSLEWPPGSGQFRDIPEVDRGEYFPIPLAHAKINPAQAAFLDRLQSALTASRPAL